jgi:RHS repeat-associated protein
VISPDGQTTSYVYDVLDRITSVTLPKPTTGSPLNFVTTYSYDNYDATNGLVFTNATDPNGRLTKTGYDALDHVVQTIDAAGDLTKFTYQFNLLQKITDANGNETSYSYNATRDLSRTTFPDGAFENYTISRGVVFSKTDRKGQVFTYSYDGLGRILSDGVASYTYNGQNLMSAGDTQFTYDSSWRRITETITAGEKTTYTYVLPPGTNPGGSLISTYKVEPPTGASWTPQTVTYVYDTSGLGRVAGLNWNWLSGGFAFNYTPNGQYSQILYPNGQRRNFSYDNQGRLTNVANLDPAGAPLASFDYGYDHDWGTGADTMLGQRTSVTVGGSAGLTPGMTKYRYDALYQLARADYPNGTYDTWTYDAIGNRINWGGSRFLNYTYYKNGANPNNGQRMRNDGQGPFDFTYDSNGNITKDSRGIPFTWDSVNRLTGSTNTSFAYDYLSRRRTMTASGSTTRYISVGMHTVGERNTAAGVATDYLFGPGVDEPLAKRTANGAISYYGADALGSIVLVTDSAGIVTSTTSYTPWGEAGSSELFGYTGRETGAPLSLWFYRARYYDANRGRFLSEDPLRFMMGPNFYAYVHNNPILLNDPFGLGDLVPIPGNPKPPLPFPNCWPDVRDFEPYGQPRPPTPIFNGVTKGVTTVILAAINIVVWNCVAAEAYCASQSDYCDCMQYANPSGYCKDIFGGCRKPHRPRNAPPPPPCGTCPISH